MKPSETNAVKSASRALDILEYVAQSPEPPSFSRALSDLGIPRSSLFHLLNNLLARGYLDRDDAGGGYRLGQAVEILAAGLRTPDLATSVMPHLRSLSDTLNETCGFYIQSGDSVEGVAFAMGRQALAFSINVGERAPLYAVSSGKIALSQLSRAEFDDYLDRVDLQPITARTLRSKSALRREITAVRKEGFGYSCEEYHPGVTGIATAVVKDGNFIGALNLAVPTARFIESRTAEFRRELRFAAIALGKALPLG